MFRPLDDVTFQGFYAWEIVSPRLNGWSLDYKASDTAIGLGLQYVAVNRERVYGAAGNAGFGILRRYLARWAYEGPSTQRNFWQFHELIHYYMGMPDWLEPIQQKRRKSLVPSTSDGIDFKANPYSAVVWAVSTRARDVIASSLLEIAYRIAGDEHVTLEDVQASLTNQIRQLATMKAALVVALHLMEAPSTATWVHNFMLWTGKSPPVAMLQFNNSHMATNVGDIGENPRSYSARHRRGHLDGRATSFDGQSNLSSRVSSPRRELPGGRHRLLDRGRSGQRTPACARHRQVGHLIPNVRQRA